MTRVIARWWLQPSSVRNQTPDIDWEFKVIKGLQSNLKARGISDRTALVLGLSAIAAMVILR